MTNTLTGKNELNKLNLTGKSNKHKFPVSSKIKNIKERILQDYLIPLFTKQWDILKENKFFISEMQKKINYYYEIYKLDELVVYIEMLKVLQILIDKHQLLEDTENTIKSKRDPNEIITVIFKTSMIRLLPEYEIYDSIVGKPKKERNETYDEYIIADIKRLLSQDKISYSKIKEHILKKLDDTTR